MLSKFYPKSKEKWDLMGGKVRGKTVKILHNTLEVQHSETFRVQIVLQTLLYPIVTSLEKFYILKKKIVLA